MTRDSSLGYQAAQEREGAQVSRIMTWLSFAAILSLAGIASKVWYSGHNKLPLTMSAGVCSIAQADSIDSMLRQADLQLYKAKAAGRNRIAPRVRSQGTNIQSEPDA
ncbi:diguanylate cyclase domain-containing protein [Marinobacter sp.]|uniref:diguanylate cyclase domain-containing protein n=1 Tax=Marinobacter sp. TaxID=50741 RepID=UPI003A8C92B8